MLTGFVGMWLASQGDGRSLTPALLLWSLLGLGLGSAGSSVFNNYYDRDIDRLMKRTIKRPQAEGRVNPTATLIFGVALSAAAFVILTLFVNLLTALLTMLALFTYAYLYTVILKRRTPLATEIGGISGSLPPLIGWAAVRGGLDFEALMLFAIMFFWQPPHFWALAAKYREDYRRAGIPTMPVVRSLAEINFRSLIYVCSLVAISFLPYLTGMFGQFYALAALIAGAIYALLYAKALVRGQDLNQQLFRYSIIYLPVLLLFMILDVNGSV